MSTYRAEYEFKLKCVMEKSDAVEGMAQQQIEATAEMLRQTLELMTNRNPVVKAITSSDATQLSMTAITPESTTEITIRGRTFTVTGPIDEFELVDSENGLLITEKSE